MKRRNKKTPLQLEVASECNYKPKCGFKIFLNKGGEQKN